tara:strand:- start:1719 stop:3041 length:1323 start_codon:yes stop_codon:yes gene_type:complete
MNIMAKNRITIIIPYRIYYYSFEPIIKYFLSKGEELLIYLPNHSFDLVNDIKNNNNLNIKSYDKLIAKYKIRKLFHSFFVLLFTPVKYSNNYKILQLRNFKNPNYGITLNFFFRIAYLVSYITPKSNNINNSVRKFMCLLFKKDIFTSTKIIVGSLNPHAHLLSSKKLKIYSIMESWDHVVKQPSGYVSRMAFLWNQDLANDWRKFNYDKLAYAVYPFKLRFSEKIRRIKQINNKTCCYAVSYSDRFKRSKISKVEHVIVEKILIACKKAGWNLLLKLRPNGRKDEFDYLLQTNSNLKISSIQSSDLDPANYFLSDKYNLKRFKFIGNATFVINCFTTFGLDSAFANIPVLQIDVRGDQTLKDSNLFYQNHHIKKYLLKDKNILKIKNGDSLEKTLEKYFNSKIDLHTNYGKSLYNWLKTENTSTINTASHFIYNKITND